MTRHWADCATCGIPGRTMREPEAYTCRSCETDTHLSGGTWVRDGLIWRWKVDEPVEAEAPRLQPCGTPAAARRHRNAGELVCEDCRAAEAAYRRARYRKQITKELAA